MQFSELVLKTRSYRRFRENERIPIAVLRDFVDLARRSASGSNMQPLKYFLSADPAGNDRIFPHLAWAGYLTEWKGPTAGERPAAYIAMLLDTEIRKDAGADLGIAAQTIMLAAAENGIGGCMIGAIKRDELRKSLGIPGRYEISLVLALGKPAERVVLEELPPGGGIKYYRDAADVHHVPKRTLDEVIVTF